MQLKSRYQFIKDFFFYYGCALSVIYAMQIIGDIIGKKLPDRYTHQNPYAFFAIVIFFLIIHPRMHAWGGRKTIADYFPNVDRD